MIEAARGQPGWRRRPCGRRAGAASGFRRVRTLRQEGGAQPGEAMRGGASRQRSRPRDQVGRCTRATRGVPRAWAMRPDDRARRIETCGGWLARHRVDRARHAGTFGEARRSLPTASGLPLAGAAWPADAMRERIASDQVARDRHAGRRAETAHSLPVAMAMRLQATSRPETPRGKRPIGRAPAIATIREGAHRPRVVVREHGHSLRKTGSSPGAPWGKGLAGCEGIPEAMRQGIRGNE
jgi:hypothetical protein